MEAGDSPRVAFATFHGEPAGALDDRLAAEELGRRGIRVAWPRWDDPDVEWGRYALVLPRSTWDYHRRSEEFLQWAERVDRATELRNPLPLIRWNAHKGYLAEMEEAGAPVVPTELVRAERREDLGPVVRRHGWRRFVIKPAIGADSDRLWVGDVGQIEEGERHLEGILRSGDALVQPFQSRVRELGERSLIFFAGRFSHACRYRAVIMERPRRVEGYAPEQEELDAARRIIDRYADSSLYARVDLLPSEGPGWLVSELELIEPELLFRGTPVGAQHFADAIAARLSARTPMDGFMARSPSGAP